MGYSRDWKSGPTSSFELNATLLFVRESTSMGHAVATWKFDWSRSCVFASGTQYRYKMCPTNRLENPDTSTQEIRNDTSTTVFTLPLFLKQV